MRGIVSHGSCWFSVVSGSCQQLLPGEVSSVVSLQLITGRWLHPKSSWPLFPLEASLSGVVDGDRVL